MRQSRRHFSVSQKAQIVRRHSAAKSLFPIWPTSSAFNPARSTPGSSRCSTKPSVLWSVRLGGHPACERLQAKLVEQLQAKLVKKNEVIAELMQEHVQLKKELGEL